MEGVFNLILFALFATNVLCIPEERLKRNYNNEHAGSTGYAIGSDERDASIEDSAPCSLLENSDSREHGYGLLGGRLENEHHGGVSVKAAAAASASSYT